jgi:general secretion pathway protein J
VSGPRRNGFTLIEVLLALALFTIIGISTVKYISQIANTKNTAFQDLDMYNNLRASVSLLRADLSEAFHIGYDDLGPDNKAALTAGTAVPHTIFDGRKSELIFTSLNHRVYYANRRESEQTEISYFLQARKGTRFQTLMKRESEIIDADLYQGGPIYTLMDDVVSLEFQFWDDKQQKWVDDWSSDQGATRDRFPMAVKMKIEVAGSGNQRLKMETQFKLAFPNNDPVLVSF